MLPGLQSVRLILALAMSSLAWNSATAQQLPNDRESWISWEGRYTLDHFSNLKGGASKGTEGLGLFEFAVSMDMHELMGWSGARIFTYGLGIHGGSISGRVGDLQAVSNIEAPSAIKIYEAWLEQDFLEERGSILLGLYDVNSEFDVIPSAGLFVNSSQGIGSEFGLSGRNGPSIFPFSSVGARLQFKPSKSWYTQLGIFDGVPGDPHNHSGTHIQLNHGDGLLMTAEVGFSNPSMDKLAIGIWTFTNDLDHWTRTDGSGDPVHKKTSPGIYALMEKSIFREGTEAAQGLSIYARTGIADGSVQPVDLYVGGGMVYSGAIPGRDEDQAGLAFGAAHLSDEFQASLAGGGSWDSWETMIELTYAIQLTDWLTIQPDLQYIINPSGDPSLDDATVIGLRLMATF